MHRLRDAVVTFVILLLVFAAFDDITTDNATAFPVEYTFLAISAIWLAFVSVQLMRNQHQVLGGLSLAALAAGIWGQGGVGPGITPGWWPEYVATVAACLWFWVLCLILFWYAWAGRSKSPNPRLA